MSCPSVPLSANPASIFPKPAGNAVQHWMTLLPHVPVRHPCAGLPCDVATSTCNGRNEQCHGRGPAWPDDAASAAVIGLRQFAAAQATYQNATVGLATGGNRGCRTLVRQGVQWDSHLGPLEQTGFL